MRSLDIYEHSEGLSLELYRLLPEYRGLEYLQTPFNTEKIRSECFVGSEAKAIYINPGVKTIGERAFKDMKNLRYIFFPEYLECIGKDALAGCDNVTILIKSTEGYFWIHPEKYDSFVDSVAREFHSSSGSWGDYDFTIVPGEPRPYNPLNRPVITRAYGEMFYDYIKTCVSPEALRFFH